MVPADNQRQTRWVQFRAKKRASSNRRQKLTQLIGGVDQKLM
jgi:hypothetical protein